MPSPRRFNCLFWALLMWWRHGGYVAMRRSRHYYGVHWMWSADLVSWYHYVPLAPRTTFIEAALHKVWFEGRVKHGDDE